MVLGWAGVRAMSWDEGKGLGPNQKSHRVQFLLSFLSDTFHVFSHKPRPNLWSESVLEREEGVEEVAEPSNCGVCA